MTKCLLPLTAISCILFYISHSFAQTKPNLLFICTDQQRWDAMSRMQEEMKIPARSRVNTPNLDKLSRQGAYFRSAYTHCAVCGPTRTSFLTGSTIEHTGIRTNWLASDANMTTAGNDATTKIPKLRTYDNILVKDFGYVAEFYGKWHSPETLGYIYSNDVRMAGAPTAWFGKYEADGTTKHLSLGLAAEFQRWLDFYKIPKPSPIQGQQTNSYTKRSYATDPLDSRYGMAPGTAAGVEPDHHGKDLCPDGFSPTACEGSESLEALDRLSKTGKPFSLTVSFHYPHAPMVPTAKYYAMYKPDSLITPKSIADALTNSAYANANNRKTIGAGYQDPIKVRRWMADYYGLVTEIDEWVGKLLTKLDSLNLSSRTLVVFMSDHGEMLGSHGLREKNIFYEESARVPFIFRMPGKIPAGIVVNQPVTNIDLHATILDYLGNKGSYPSDGRSLRRFIEDTSASEEYIVTEWNYTDSRAPRAAGSELNFMIRFGSWKLMVPNTAASTVKDMLFNISSDPYEVSNLVGLNGLTASNAVIGKAEHLKALLAEYLTKMNHPAMTEIKNRRKWKTVDLWVSDTLIDFGTITRGKTKAESLYLGRTITGSVAISGMTLSGPGAANYKLSWTSGSIANGGQQIVTITYTDPGTGSAAGNAKITISHNAAGAARTVTLVSPKVTATALFQNKSNARNPVGASMKISYDKNRLRVTSHDNSFWKLTLCSLNGQAVREFSGQGSAQIACRTAPGIYLFRTEKPGTVRSGLLMIR